METYEYSNLTKCPVEFDELAHTYTREAVARLVAEP
jgi:hypothetical protein